MAIDVLKEYLQEYSGNIMIFSGVLLLVVGLMFVETFGSLVSVFAFFFGIIFLAFGFFARLGLFYSMLSSLNRLGTILICVSVVLLALSFAVIQYQAVKSVVYIPQYFHGVIEGYTTQINAYRPYAWLSLASAEVGLPILCAGLIAKAISARR
jgi:hypothetical protein